MKLNLPHALAPAEAARRLAEAARELDVTLTPEADGLGGELERSAPLIGSVRARYRVLEAEVEIEVTRRPGLLPEGTLRRMLEEELGRRLA